MKKKPYTLHFVTVGTPEQSTAIIKKLVRDELLKGINRNGAVCTNLEEVLDKYVSCVPNDKEEIRRS